MTKVSFLGVLRDSWMWKWSPALVPFRDTLLMVNFTLCIVWFHHFFFWSEVCAMVRQPLKSQYTSTPEFLPFDLILLVFWYSLVHDRVHILGFCDWIFSGLSIAKNPGKPTHHLVLAHTTKTRLWIVCCGFGCLVIFAFACIDLLIGSLQFQCFSFSTTLLPFID